MEILFTNMKGGGSILLGQLQRYVEELQHQIDTQRRSCASFTKELMPPLIKAADSNYLSSTNFTLLYEKKKAVKSPLLYHAAVCSIENMKPEHHSYLQHFPHLMQLLFPCIDYWLEYSNYTPILLYTAEQLEYLNMSIQKNDFAKGVLLVLESNSFASPAAAAASKEGGMKMMSFQGYLDSKYFHPNQSIQSYSLGLNKGFLFRHSREWNDKVYHYFFKEEQEEGNYISSEDSKSHSSTKIQKPATYSQQQRNKCMEVPRIRILNRKRTRSIFNTKEILDELVDLYNDMISKNNTTNKPPTNHKTFPPTPPSVVFFEEATFQQQAEFFFSTDILVSVHGAQLTGISMMGLNPCAQILELFPSNYCLPNYFGTLAAQAGVHHSYMHFDAAGGNGGNGNETTEAGILSAGGGQQEQNCTVSSTLEERVQARSANLCPSKNLLRSAVSELIHDWKKCCHDHQHHHDGRLG